MVIIFKDRNLEESSKLKIILTKDHSKKTNFKDMEYSSLKMETDMKAISKMVYMMDLENTKPDKKDLIREILKKDCITEKEFFAGGMITYMKVNIKMERETDTANSEKVKASTKDFGLMGSRKTVQSFKNVPMNLKLIYKN